ncbi:hypothetical protein BJX70DRAFT_381724 [Aspergillus crustosus]
MVGLRPSTSERTLYDESYCHSPSTDLIGSSDGPKDKHIEDGHPLDHDAHSYQDSTGLPFPATYQPRGGIVRWLRLRFGGKIACWMVMWTMLVALSCVLILWVAVSELTPRDEEAD